MPDVQRTVSTLLKVDGEQQYKAAIANINREQQNLKASIRLVDEQFRGQANTMAALIEKEKLFVSQQTVSNQKLTAAREMYDKAQAAVKKYSDEITKLKNYVAKDAEEEQKLAKQLQTAQENLSKAQNSTVFYSKSVTNAQIEVEKINRSIKDNAKYMSEAKSSADGTATSIDGYGKQVKVAKENTEDLNKSGTEAFNSLAQALVAAGLIRSVGELVDLFKQAAEASISFESAFTGVTKTVEGSPEQLAAIKDQMKALSTEIPLTADELSKIAQIAGQLGISTDDISAFTETIAALTVSTNLSADQAATQLARFAKITGMQASEYDNLGAVIVALGNTSAATESEIVNMGMGISAAGKQVGMTQPQIMAFAAGMTSSGLESQAGGTAISKTLVEMSLAAETGGEALDKFANIAGMSSEAFASLFKTSAADALNAFITGLASGSESAISALNDMGITEIRQRDAILRLANAGDTLTKSINTANTAFEENTALSEESAKFYNTTESKIQLLKNSVNLLAITVGDQYNPAIRGAVSTLTEWTDSINDYLEENPAAVSAITGFATALGVLALAVAGGTVIVNIAIPAITAFNAALAANPIGIVVIALAALAAGLAAATFAAKESTAEIDQQIEKNKELVRSIEEAKDAYEDNLNEIESQRDAAESLIDTLDDLLGSQTRNGENSEQIKNVVDQLNASVSGLNLTYDDTARALNMTTDSIRAQTQAMFAQKVQAAYLDRQVAVYVEMKDIERELAETQKTLSDETSKQNDLLEKAAEIGGENVTLAAQYSKQAEELTPKIRKLKKEQEELNDRNAEAAKEYEYLTDAATGAAEAMDDVTSGSLPGASESAESLTDSLDAMKTAWAESKDSALDAANKMAGALDTLDGKGKASIDTIENNQKKQAQFWIDYSANLEKAKELGLNADWLAELSTPTEENAQLLDSIVNGSVDKVKELNQAYEDNAKAREDFASASATAKTEADGLVAKFAEDLDAFVNDMDQSEAAYSNGESTILGLLGGIESKLPDFYTLVNQILAEYARINGLNWNLPGSAGGTTRKVDNPNYRQFATGLDYVPYDNFEAYLHKGETVLTAKEAISWRSLKSAIAAATPSTAALTNMPRQISARDISGAVGSAVSGIQKTQKIESTMIFQTTNPTPSEIARATERQLRKLVNT